MTEHTLALAILSASVAGAAVFAAAGAIELWRMAVSSIKVWMDHTAETLR